MGRPTAPCIECMERTANCHASCALYQKYKEEHDRWNQEVLNNKLEAKELWLKPVRKRKA